MVRGIPLSYFRQTQQTVRKHFSWKILRWAALEKYMNQLEIFTVSVHLASTFEHKQKLVQTSPMNYSRQRYVLTVRGSDVWYTSETEFA